MENAQIRDEMTQIQHELLGAFEELRTQVWKKLKPVEREEIETEFNELNVMLERLKDGKIWLAVVGRTCVGKSSVINSILGEDKAEVDETQDTTAFDRQTLKPNTYEVEGKPWIIIDLPGIMGKLAYEEFALNEAKKAHGHVFVIAGEPFQDEIEIFDKVHEVLPDTPKIVFVNKNDELQHKPSRDREAVKARIVQKMSKYVKSSDNIVYGSARLYNPDLDDWERQEIPQLLDRMYEDAGTFGQVVSVIDPANKAHNASEMVKQRILDVRMKIARRAITAFSTACAVATYVPASHLITDPGILGGMVYTICRMMGKQVTRKDAKSLAGALVKACLSTLGVEIMGAVAVEIVLQAALFIPAIGLLALPALGAMGYFRYRRTVILGEVTLEYVKRDFSWGGEDASTVIKQCVDRAKKMYLQLSSDKALAA
jgi:GTPase Era involved in 16S rRNA processing/uncharacterized protein (DUF697 family)